MLPPPGQTAALTIPGSAGKIQAALSMPAESAQPAGVALILHPHPLYGGTLDNKVVTTLARCCTQAGLAALRINFRGVGQSEGHFDNGEGETEDTLAALDWLRAETGAAQHVLLGFSFGGWIAVRAAVARTPAQLVTIAPALREFGSEPVPAPGCPWLLIHSEDDDVVDCADTLARARAALPAVDARVLSGAGHFYHGRLGELRDLVLPVLQARWAELGAAT